MKKQDMAALEVELREQFQTARRRLDMLERLKALGPIPTKQLEEVMDAIRKDNEEGAKRLMKIIKVSRG